MAKRLYIGNLSFNTTQEALTAHLQSLGGKCVSVEIKQDPYTNRSRGFGFAEMSSDAETQAAIDQLAGKELDGRALTINEARPMEPRSDRGGGGRGRRDRGGGASRGGESPEQRAT
jgi:RNA recognition motif-containing protein